MGIPKDPVKRVEWIKNIGKGHKGIPPWNKGLKLGHLSEELKRKIADANMGQKRSEEARQKMSEVAIGRKYPKDRYPNHGMRGKKMSEETKKKMSLAHSGINHPMYGKHHSEESKRKMSESSKGQIAWNKGLKGVMPEPWNKGKKFSKFVHPLYGKKHKPESIEKMSKSHKGRVSNNKGKTYEEIVGIEKAKLIKERIKKARTKQITPIKNTKIEIKVQMFLKELGYEFFTHQYMKGIEHGYQCDILIPSLNLVIECDGDYWHKYPIGTDLDHIRTKELLEKGFKVLRLWECEIKKMDINKFKEDIDTIKSGE